MLPSSDLSPGVLGAITELILITDIPVHQAGLRAALLPHRAIAILAEGTTLDDAAALTATFQPDLLLLPSVLGKHPTLPLLPSLATAAPSMRTLIFADQPDDALLRAFVLAGIWGWVLTVEPLDRIVQAIAAVGDGERWFSQPIMAQLLVTGVQPQERAVLTGREQAVVRQLVAGGTNDAIGARLGLSERTVRFHLKNIFAKLGVTSRSQVVAWAVRADLAPRSAAPSSSPSTECEAPLCSRTR